MAMNDQLPMPIVLFTDFGAAFPSVIHEWLFLDLALEMEGFPPGLRNFIVGIHSQVTAYGLAGSMAPPLCFIPSGVIQGCPLASDCFLFAFNPFPVMFGPASWWTFVSSASLVRVLTISASPCPASSTSRSLPPSSSLLDNSLASPSS